jgi:hypothetical protein
MTTLLTAPHGPSLHAAADPIVNVVSAMSTSLSASH